MFILAIRVNRAWFNAQLCHSTLCLLLLMPVKLHWLPWNHHYSEQIETGGCSAWTAAVSFQVSETGTAEWSVFSELHKVIVTLMPTVKGPALLSLWICLTKSMGAMHISPTSICMLCFTSHLHTFLFFNPLETFKKIQPPLLKFSMFHFWPKVSLDSLKSQRKIPLAACELEWSAKTKKHFPPFERASSHISLRRATPTIQHKGAAHRPYEGLTPPFNRQ